MYYVQGRYYNPKSGSYLNADNPTRLLDNAYILNGLDRHAATLDNLVSKEINLLSIFTTNKYYPDPSYYSSEGKSWWDLNWKKVVAPVLFVLSTVLMLIPGTQCIGINMLQMGVKFAITGMIFGGVVSGIMAAIQGENIWKAVHEGMVNGFLDGYILGSIMGFVTSFTSVCGNCFKAGTLVLTSEGHKKIEDIQVGDKVWAYDEKSQSKRLKKVVQVFQNKTKKWLHIHINQEEIICTPEHPFYVIDAKEVPTLQFEGREAFQYEGEWVASKDLKEGMQVLLANGKYATIEVVETEELDTFETTYNFEVEDVHTYFVSSCNVLVHNQCKPDVVDTPIDELNHTNGQILSQTKFGNLINDIKINGIQEPIKITEINGSKYILDGNHRVAAAKILKMKNVPTKIASLPYKDFTTIEDVLWANSEYISRWRWK